MSRPCRLAHTDPAAHAGCPYCDRYRSDRRYREICDAGGVTSSASRTGPCPHLGPVREAATCCGGVGAVFACLHDDAPWDLCTLGPNARPGEVGDCSSCPLRPE